MQNNFTNDTAEKLIKYMDNELDADERESVEILLQNEASAREQYQFFLAAKGTVRSEGMRQRVAGIQRNFLDERKGAENKPAVKKKRSSFKPLMSTAAVLIFLLIGYGTFQYLTTTSEKVYNDAYIGYQLPVSRGSDATSKIEELYNNGHYQSVVSSLNSMQDKSQKEYFIVGLSYLQLNNASEAVKAFQWIERLNNKSEKKRYVQETDYYLMLAYIKAGDVSHAEKKWDNIRSDKDHLFYEKAQAISHTQLLILKWKEK